MTEYIDRQAALGAVARAYGDTAEAEDNIRALPAADVRENVKGKWIDGRQMGFDGSLYWYRECDQCGYKRKDDNPDRDSKFCPNCGADMRTPKGTEG